MLALGVDVSVSRGLDFVLLDNDRRLDGPPLRGQTKDDLARVLAERQPDIVALDSPQKPGTSGGSRLAERELLRLGLHSYFTPSDPKKAKNKFYGWMPVGFDAFKTAYKVGYPPFTGNGSVRGFAIEVFPHGSAVALKGSLPPSGTCRSSGRKRRWRADVLESHSVDAGRLRSTDEVDAALAALTGLLALEGEFWTVGDPTEGAIVLPGKRPVGPFPRE